jgi:DNA-binding transcriptional MocR family regulator
VHSAELVIIILILEACALRDLILSQEVLTKQGGGCSQVLANFMGIVMGGRLTFDPAGVIITAGAGAAIEMLVFCLAQPGEAILIPSPYYHGYFTYLLPCIHHPYILLCI